MVSTRARISSLLHSRAPTAMPATSPPGRTRNVAGSPVTRQAREVRSSASSRIGDARLLERVERRGGVLRMVAAFLAGPPQRERPEQGAEEEDGEPRARERRVPSLADETKSASG